MLYKKGFTLAELLVALTIISVIAVLTLAKMPSTVYGKIHVLQMKNFLSTIQDVVGAQMLKYRAKDLRDTDFATADKLLTSDNFKIEKICEASSAQRDCWGTLASGGTEEEQLNNAKIKYHYSSILNGSTFQPSARKTVLLANGVMFSYVPYSPESTAEVDGEEVTVPAVDSIIEVDINGNDAPNIVGEDFFTFYISNSGQIHSIELSLNDAKYECENGVDPFACIVANDKLLN